MGHTWLAVGSAAVVLAAGGGVPAHARSAPTPERGRPAAVDDRGFVTEAARLSDGTVVNSRAAEERVRRYWTAKRMRSAEPMEPVDRAAAGGARGTRAVHLPEAKTVGKAFFTDPGTGTDRSCSGAAVVSPSGRLVITAGACVHEGRGGGFMRNWVFVPRYRNGGEPFGTFVNKQLTALNGWINDGDRRRNVGVSVTGLLNGRSLKQVVGGNRLRVNSSRTASMTVFDYPGNGGIQYRCQGTSTALADGRIRLGCAWTGTLGGPWLQDYEEKTGSGWVNGVIGGTSAGAIISPYFDTAVKDMCTTVGGLIP